MAGAARPAPAPERAGTLRVATELAADVWVDGGPQCRRLERDRASRRDERAASGNGRIDRDDVPRADRRPRSGAGGEPAALAATETPVIVYPFELRSHGNRVR